jgi:rubrerythrin
MEEEYWTDCVACDTETQVMVIDNDEAPQNCPMCGYPTSYELIEDED